MTLLIGSLTIGLILSLLAMGVFISFRIFDFADITADGSITLGAAVSAILIVKGINPALATSAGFCSGLLAGATTGVLHTKFKINSLLSGILVMTALYSAICTSWAKVTCRCYPKPPCLPMPRISA